MDDRYQRRTWSVIKFPDEEAVSAVPSSWVVVGGNKCLWPPYNSKLIRLAIEKNEEPDFEHWAQYPCVSFRNNVYDTFKEANRKSLLATKTSDLESASEELTCAVSSKNRKIFKKTYSFSSVEEVDDTDLIPNPPQMKKSQVAEQRQNNIQQISTQSKTAIQPSTSSAVTETESESKQIIKYLETIIRKQNLLQATIMDLNSRLTNMENKKAPEPEIHSVFTEAVHLPVDSEADLDALEFLLASQMDLAVKEISNLGGASIYDFIHRATLKLITNGFCGREYSYEGRRQKKSFRNLKVHELLTKSSMQLFTTTEKEVEMNIQKWIRRCTERAKAKLQN